ncbi:MAG: SGNH/GDSL hydrolase family protein [Planctomycetota bacterium]
MKTRRRRVLGALAAVAIGCVGAALVAEVAWRVLEPRPLGSAMIVNPDGSEVPLSRIVDYVGRMGNEQRHEGPVSRLAPDMDVRFRYDGPPMPWHDEKGCIAVRSNSLGFRDEEFSATKPAGQVRLLCVGDSFTFGNGVEAEDTRVEQAEDLLRERLHTDVQAVNAASPRARPTSPATALDPRPGPALRPRPRPRVVPQRRRSDPDGSRGSGRRRLGTASSEPPPTHFRQMRADRAFDHAVLPDAALVVRAHPEQWEAAQQGIVATRDACAEHGVPLLVVVIPMMYRLDDGYPCRELHAMITAFCESVGVPSFDGYPPFAGRAYRSLWAHPSDQHPNPAGHRILAEALVDPVVDLLGPDAAHW